MGEEPRAPTGEVEDDESHPTDEEQVETEWHLWVLAFLVIAGIALFLFPPFDWLGFAVLLLGLAAIGWVVKTMTEWSFR